MTHAAIDTPMGPMRAAFTNGGALRRLHFAEEAEPAESATPMEALAAQLHAYFRGERKAALLRHEGALLV